MSLRIEILELQDYLKRKGYSSSYIDSLNRVWKKFSKFFIQDETRALTFNGQNEFLLQEYGASLNGKPRPHTIKQYQAFRAVNLLNEFISHKSISIRYEPKKDSLPEEFEKAIECFIEYGREKLKHRERTTRTEIRWIRRFLAYAVSRNITTLNQLSEELLISYLNTYPDRSPRTKLLYVNAVKHFDDCIFMKHKTKSRFVANLKINFKKNEDFIPTWSRQEILQLLASLDLNNAIELRDYAMILIAATLGLRISDILRLKFKDIDFRNHVIYIKQYKTGVPNQLPLPNSVGWAIIDYAKKGRPKSDSEFIFLKHSVPIGPFNADSNSHLYNQITKYMRRAGIVRERGKGFHSFRHALATCLVNEGISIENISSILGHASIQSTNKYISLDEKDLALCPINLDDFLNKNGKDEK